MKEPPEPKGYILWFVIILSLFIGACSAFVGAGVSKKHVIIKGKVIDERGHPMKNIIIYMKKKYDYEENDRDDRILGTSTTDESGVFLLSGRRLFEGEEEIQEIVVTVDCEGIDTITKEIYSEWNSEKHEYTLRDVTLRVPSFCKSAVYAVEYK